MPQIHPTAIVSPKAELADDVVVGPYATIEEHVTIGPGTVIKTGCHLTGYTTIGARNQIGPHAVLGTPPQDITYRGEVTRLVIGDDNILREFVSAHCGSTKQDLVTAIGNQNFLMAYCHIGHDCELGNGIVMANMVGLSGHCRVEDMVWFGGMTGIHQFITIGKYAFVGGMSGVVHDCPPFMVSEGRPAKVRGLNSIGLRRRGFASEAIESLKEAQRLIYRSHLTASQAMDQITTTWPEIPAEVSYLLTFLRRSHAERQGRMREILRHS
jgi:UDP-N-acetylglucosamine acyltransferase